MPIAEQEIEPTIVHSDLLSTSKKWKLAYTLIPHSNFFHGVLHQDFSGNDQHNASSSLQCTLIPVPHATFLFIQKKLSSSNDFLSMCSRAFVKVFGFCEVDASSWFIVTERIECTLRVLLHDDDHQHIVDADNNQQNQQQQQQLDANSVYKVQRAVYLNLKQRWKLIGTTLDLMKILHENNWSMGGRLETQGLAILDSECTSIRLCDFVHLTRIVVNDVKKDDALNKEQHGIKEEDGDEDEELFLPHMRNEVVKEWRFFPADYFANLAVIKNFKKADIYCLAMVLVDMWWNKQPFEEELQEHVICSLRFKNHWANPFEKHKFAATLVSEFFEQVKLCLDSQLENRPTVEQLVKTYKRQEFSVDKEIETRSSSNSYSFFGAMTVHEATCIVQADASKWSTLPDVLKTNEQVILAAVNCESQVLTRGKTVMRNLLEQLLVRVKNNAVPLDTALVEMKTAIMSNYHAQRTALHTEEEHVKNMRADTNLKLLIKCSALVFISFLILWKITWTLATKLSSVHVQGAILCVAMHYSVFRVYLAYLKIDAEQKDILTQNNSRGASANSLQQARSDNDHGATNMLFIAEFILMLGVQHALVNWFIRLNIFFYQYLAVLLGCLYWY